MEKAMARIRYLKPDFFKDEDIAKLPYEARLFFAGLWCLADKSGRLEDRPERLKIEIFPYDNVDAEKLVSILASPKKSTNRPFIKRYEVDGEKYIQILTWNLHQKPHGTERDSVIPPCLNSSLTVKEQINSVGMGMGKGMEKRTEKGGMGENKNALSRERIDEIKAQLKAFYDLCPYLKMTRRDNADLQLLAMNTKFNLWDEWLQEIYKNRPFKDTFDYWAGSFRARLQEFDGKALKNEAKGDKRLLGEILKGIGSG